MPKMLTASEAAEMLGLRPATIRSWIWKRQIRYVKVSRSVRIPADEVQRMIESGTRPAMMTKRQGLVTLGGARMSAKADGSYERDPGSVANGPRTRGARR